MLYLVVCTVLYLFICSRCVLNMVQISWSISVATAVLLPSSSALARLTSVTCVTTTSSRLPVFPSRICHSVLVVPEERSSKGMNALYTSSTLPLGKNSPWDAECVEMLILFKLYVVYYVGIDRFKDTVIHELHDVVNFYNQPWMAQIVFLVKTLRNYI